MKAAQFILYHLSMQMNRNHDDLRHLSHGGKVAPAGTRCQTF